MGKTKTAPLNVPAQDLVPNQHEVLHLMASADAILANHSGGKDSGATVASIALLAAELGVLDRVQVVHNPSASSNGLARPI